MRVAILKVLGIDSILTFYYILYNIKHYIKSNNFIVFHREGVLYSKL
jgi:hypothetical protein